MGYQALLFCPDEKTARTVTQVLSELEFNVEACTEPFAAVKKLMSQHFDAVVVDCDNEQNATLLFKSARNSTSNQASLAVAVVEGQAGVAKAFRIGANLVLTKPINVEQAKGTLRVARGLLRKSEPAKPGVAATAPSAGIPVVNAPAKQKTQALPLAVSTAIAQSQSDASSVTHAPSAAAISSAGARDEDLLDIGEEDSLAATSEATPLAPTFKGFITPAPQAEKFLAAAVVSAAPEGKSASIPISQAHGRGAASAPAPAREREDARVPEAPPQRSGEADAPSKKAEVAQSQPSSLAGSAPAFSFGGNNATTESSGGGKKILATAAAALIVAAIAYASWARFHGRSSGPDTTPTEDTPTTVVSPQATRPNGAKPSAASTAKPSSSLSLPNSQAAALNEKGHGSDADSAFDDSDPSAASSTKASASGSSASSATADTDEAPLVVKGGKAPAVHAKSGAADTPPPSMIGIATAGAGAPPPNFVSSAEIAPKPLLETLNISQGVSHGLLIKKVQPTYPRNALAMRLEGSVELLATISKTGDITQVKVLSGDSQLTKAATDAVKQWKYKPYLLNGEPVEIQTQVTINFKLPK
jgi:TonB family protein